MAEKKTTTKKAKKVQEPLKPIKAYARSLRIAPRKMRLVTNLVKKQHALDALVTLQFTNKKGAPMLAKLIKSAIANADHNFQYKPETLFIKEITCDEGQSMNRYFPRARGSAFVIRRKMSHVNLTLESRPGQAKKTASLVKLKAKTEAAPVSEDAVEAAHTPIEKKKGPKYNAAKSGELVKENKAQNKRRLFNRKSGE